MECMLRGHGVATVRVDAVTKEAPPVRAVPEGLSTRTWPRPQPQPQPQLQPPAPAPSMAPYMKGGQYPELIRPGQSLQSLLARLRR